MIRRWWARLIARQGRWPRLLVALACIAVVGIYCGNQDMGGDPNSPRGDGKYRPVLGRGDGHMLYLMARSTALDGDWVFDNDLARFGDPWNQAVGPTGRKVIPHPIGPALLWTPLIWIAEAGAVVVNLFGADIPLHGYTLWHQRFVFLSSALAGCALALLGLRVARRVVGGTWAPSYAAVAILLGTPLTYYTTVMPGYGHALDALACGGFLAYWATTLGRRDRRRYIVLGVLLGVSMLIRMQELALGVVITIEAAASIRDRRDLARVVVGGVITLGVALVVFSPQFLYWRLVYGDFLAVPQGAKYTRLGSPMILELLYSPRNGWFSITPVAYAAVIGLFCLPRSARLLGIAFGAVVAIQVYLDSTIMDYWGMASFGQRRMCDTSLVLVVGLAALLWRLGRLVVRVRVPRYVWHAVTVIVFGSLVAWNLMRVLELHAGKPAPSEPSPTCCDRVPPVLRGPMSAVFDVIGNPFEFPANALFAIRHGVSIQRWDAIGGYPLVPPANTLLDDSLWKQRGSWRLGHPGAEPYLITGWSKSMPGTRPFRWTTEPVARALVPNLMPERQRISVWLQPGGTSDVELRWDGDVVASSHLEPGWHALAFEIDKLSVGEHELEIAATLGVTQAAPLPVGVGVGSVDLELMPPR